MKTNELTKIIEGVVVDEVKKVITESMNENKISRDIKSFQTLYGISEKISSVDQEGNRVTVSFEPISMDEIVHFMGTDDISKGQTRLMQGIHHDLEDGGYGNNADVIVNIEGDDTLDMSIIIDLDKNEMVDETMTTNEKEELLLGDKNKSLKENKMRKKLTLNETQMRELLEKIVTEARNTLDPTTEKSQSDSERENNDYLSMVEKKIKKYLSFKGNDNPEFPDQIGKVEKKMARQNSKEQEEEVDDNRGRGPQDLNYDNLDEEDPQFSKYQERLEMSLNGDPKMGNSKEASNVIKTDTGEKVLKTSKRRKEIKKKDPIYKKEEVPVKTMNESNEKTTVLKEEISRMKNIIGYDKSTQ